MSPKYGKEYDTAASHSPASVVTVVFAGQVIVGAIGSMYYVAGTPAYSLYKLRAAIREGDIVTFDEPGDFPYYCSIHGTKKNGQTAAIRVLPFKSTLFEAFFAPALVRIMHIQPVTVIFHAPDGEDPRHYGWWGDMNFASHLLKTLATARQGRVEVIFHPEVPVDAFENRKALSQHCERVIRTTHVHAAS